MACPCPPLDDADIAAHAYRAGFRGAGLRAAVAIALRESGGRACCSGDESIQTATWGPSIGLWQVRTLKAETGRGTVRDLQRLQQGPAEQAAAAFAISSGGRSWAPWTTARSGLGPSSPFMARAATAAAAAEAGQQPTGTRVGLWSDTWGTIVDNAKAAPGNAAGAAAGAVADATGLSGLVDLLTDRTLWIRVGKIIGGMLAIGLGLFVIFRDTVTQAAKVAGTAAVVA